MFSNGFVDPLGLIVHDLYRSLSINSTFNQIAARPKDNTTKRDCRKLATNFHKTTNNESRTRNSSRCLEKSKTPSTQQTANFKLGGGGVCAASRIGDIIIHWPERHNWRSTHEGQTPLRARAAQPEINKRGPVHRCGPETGRPPGAQRMYRYSFA